jgi:hypothetical protein
MTLVSFKRIDPTVFLAFLSNCIFLGAQDASTVAMRGTVSDASGARIVGAQISVVSTATAIARQLRTGETGEFAVEMLQPGEYWVRVNVRGMGKQEQQVRPEIGGAARLKCTRRAMC